MFFPHILGFDMTSLNTQDTPRWSFVRLGGFDQVVLDDADSIRGLRHLDQKLWSVLASPVRGTYLDERTLELMDTDDDQRIRAPEILEAIAWIDDVLEDLGALVQRTDGLPIDQIREDTASGQLILESARKLASAHADDDQILSVEETSQATQTLYAMPFNGDGVITAHTLLEARATPELTSTFEDIIATLGDVPDRSGKPGVDTSKIEAFYEEVDAYIAWWNELDAHQEELAALGSDIARAVEAFAAVHDKIQDFFMRCDLVAFDPRAQLHLTGREEQWSKLSHTMITEDTLDVESFPLAKVAPGAQLPLVEGINPGWRAEMREFFEVVIIPLYGAQNRTLTHTQWDELVARFKPYQTWLDAKTGARVESLGITRLCDIRDAQERDTLLSLIEQDLAVKPQADALESVERATRYYRDLHTLLENFVNIKDFYRTDIKSIFQSGELYLDGRTCTLCLDVEDPATHMEMAQRSYAYLVYCKCTRQGETSPRFICAAFTDGDNDFLIKGRNGIFYDRQGRDWDARITHIVEQPISIRQAFWSPYKRAFRFLSTQIEALTAERDTTQQKALDQKVLDVKTSTTSGDKPVTSPKQFDIARYAGIFAAVGLAAGFIVSSLTLLVTSFLGLKSWQMPLVIIGFILLISGPSMLLAAFKLKQRHLAPLLDANGWAVNTRARLNIRFGAALTDVARLPDGSKRAAYADPYSERSLWSWIIGLCVILGCILSWHFWA